MNESCSRKAIHAFTIIELLVVVAVLAILAAMLLPVFGRPDKARIVQCMSNQKQIAVGLSMWSEDHNQKFPWQVSVTNGGTMELTATGQAAIQFQAIDTLTNHLSVFHCPTDRSRRWSAHYSVLFDTNLSYLIRVDSSRNRPLATQIQLGDRHLQADGQPVSPGLFSWTTNNVVNWTRELHREGRLSSRGNLGFTDGHVETVRGERLNSVFEREGLSAKQLAVP